MAAQDSGKNQAEQVAQCSPRRETALQADMLLWGDHWEQRLLEPRLPVTPKPLQVFAAVEKIKIKQLKSCTCWLFWRRGLRGLTWRTGRACRQPSGPLQATQLVLPGKVRFRMALWGGERRGSC